MEGLNFSWVIPNKLAGCAGPRQGDDLLFLRRQGITMLVRLAENDEAMVTSQQVMAVGLMDLHVPVYDSHAPSQAQLDIVTSQVRRCIFEGGRVAISCKAGVGRTGMMLSCVLVSMGFPLREALETVKRMRNQLEAYESSDQHDAIITFTKRNDQK
jgi:atypical dual specificity phosphatase